MLGYGLHICSRRVIAEGVDIRIGGIDSGGGFPEFGSCLGGDGLHPCAIGYVCVEPGNGPSAPAGDIREALLCLVKVGDAVIC